MDKYFCYIKGVWSNDFDALKEGVSKFATFLIDEKDRFLIEISKTNVNDLTDLLKKSVTENAWHDFVNKDEAHLVFKDEVVVVPMNIGAENIYWQKMKNLEPSIRDFANLKEMITSSQYHKYL